MLKRKKMPLNAKKLQKSASTTHLRVEALGSQQVVKKMQPQNSNAGFNRQEYFIFTLRSKGDLNYSLFKSASDFNIQYSFENPFFFKE